MVLWLFKIIWILWILKINIIKFIFLIINLYLYFKSSFFWIYIASNIVLYMTLLLNNQHHLTCTILWHLICDYQIKYRWRWIREVAFGWQHHPIGDHGALKILPHTAGVAVARPPWHFFVPLVKLGSSCVWILRHWPGWPNFQNAEMPSWHKEAFLLNKQTCWMLLKGLIISWVGLKLRCLWPFWVTVFEKKNRESLDAGWSLYACPTVPILVVSLPGGGRRGCTELGTFGILFKFFQ